MLFRSKSFFGTRENGNQSNILSSEVYLSVASPEKAPGRTPWTGVIMKQVYLGVWATGLAGGAKNVVPVEKLI